MHMASPQSVVACVFEDLKSVQMLFHTEHIYEASLQSVLVSSPQSVLAYVVSDLKRMKMLFHTEHIHEALLY